MTWWGGGGGGGGDLPANCEMPLVILCHSKLPRMNSKKICAWHSLTAMLNWLWHCWSEAECKGLTTGCHNVVCDCTMCWNWLNLERLYTFANTFARGMDTCSFFSSIDCCGPSPKRTRNCAGEKRDLSTSLPQSHAITKHHFMTMTLTISSCLMDINLWVLNSRQPIPVGFLCPLVQLLPFVGPRGNDLRLVPEATTVRFPGAVRALCSWAPTSWWFFRFRCWICLGFRARSILNR